jgi:hypothetical protein
LLADAVALYGAVVASLAFVVALGALVWEIVSFVTGRRTTLYVELAWTTESYDGGPEIPASVGLRIVNRSSHPVRVLRGDIEKPTSKDAGLLFALIGTANKPDVVIEAYDGIEVSADVNSPEFREMLNWDGKEPLRGTVLTSSNHWFNSELSAPHLDT